MMYINDLKSYENEETIYIDEQQQENDMNEYEKSYDLSCDLITNFSDIQVPDELILITKMIQIDILQKMAKASIKIQYTAIYQKMN